MTDVLVGLAVFLVLRSLWRSWVARRRQERFRRQWEERYRNIPWPPPRHVNCRCDVWQQDRVLPHPLRHRCIGEEASRELYEEVMR